MKQNRRTFIATTALLGTGLATAALPTLKTAPKKGLIHPCFLLVKKSFFQRRSKQADCRFKNIKKN
jgi:hypothetical protein